jgi:O-antigen ligase
LCGLAIATLAMFVDRRVALKLFGPGWIAMFALVALSAVTAGNENTVRSVAFALIVTVMAASVTMIAPTAQAMERILLYAAGTVLFLCYFGVVALPAAAIHQPVGTEAFHAGLWRGLYTHKNIAGPVLASVAFVGIYLMRRGRWFYGGLITVAALIFVLNTGSKTSAALIPAIIALIALPAMAGLRGLAAALVLAAIFTIHALTVGTVFVPLFDAILRAFDATTTYTGRIAIWDFAGDYIAKQPWTGYGFDNFWRTPIVTNGEQPFDRSWDPRGTIHGHHGFLDLALFMGFPALALSVWLFVIAPVIDYLRVPPLRENVLLADLWLMIVAFVTMNAALESFFFRRDDPVWLTLVVALFGLRVVARMRIRSS